MGDVVSEDAGQGKPGCGWGAGGCLPVVWKTGGYSSIKSGARLSLGHWSLRHWDSTLHNGEQCFPTLDLCGYMHFWGLTIDVVSAVNVIIAIGLCVDYSVHICHAFLTVSGSKKERAHAAMVDMGPAVLNGGVSTLIAFILLVSSDSHVFSSFFKIFLLV